MTFRSSINSKGKPRDFLKRGFKSMFSNYDGDKQSATPVDSEGQRKKQAA